MSAIRSLATTSRRLLRLLAVAALAGLLVGADPLFAWTQAPEAQRPGWLQGWAEGWVQATHRLGLDRPYKRLRAGRDAVEILRFAPAPD